MGTAPTYDLSTANLRLAGIEYPGPVNSIPRAVASLGGFPAVSASLASPLAHAAPIELNLNPDNPFFHTILAASLDSGNVVMKVVKRRRKRPKLDANGMVLEHGVFTLEVAGVVERTVRFRSMADFQYTPKVVNDPIINVAQALRTMDIAVIRDFSFPAPDETFSEEHYLPPPVFSRQTLPHVYDYKPIAASVPTTATKPSGEEYQRLVNGTRFKTGSQVVIPFSQPNVPTGPGEDLVKVRSPTNAAVEQKLLALLEQRPVWTRSGLLNQLTDTDSKMCINHKGLVSLVSYTFGDGAFRELCVKWGYDPRKHPEARFFQHLTYRNIENPRWRRGEKAKQVTTKEVQSRLSHIFDGRDVHSKVGNFQLCDVSDPLSKKLIESTDGVLPACSDESEGWYDPDYFEQFRQVVRRKFIGIHSGIMVTDADCEDLIGDPKSPEMLTRKKATALSNAFGSEGAGDAGGSDDGSGTEEEEDDSKSATSGASRSEKESSAAAGAGTKRVFARNKVKRAPWEAPRKKGTKAKQRMTTETVEEKAARLRRAIGLGGPVASGSGLTESGADDIDDE